jgi:hypothetical protein
MEDYGLKVAISNFTTGIEVLMNARSRRQNLVGGHSAAQPVEQLERPREGRAPAIQRGDKCMAARAAIETPMRRTSARVKHPSKARTIHVKREITHYRL